MLPIKDVLDALGGGLVGGGVHCALDSLDAGFALLDAVRLKQKGQHDYLVLDAVVCGDFVFADSGSLAASQHVFNELDVLVVHLVVVVN